VAVKTFQKKEKKEKKRRKKKKKEEKNPTTTGIERQKRVWCEWGAFLLYGHKCLRV
jgi:hypothetical protein